MKAAASAIVTLMGALLALPSMTDGAREKFTVSEGDVVFTINRYDDGRSFPTVVNFFHLGLKSVYKFNNGGDVTQINVDGEKYTVEYNSDVPTVTGSFDRRNLVEGVQTGIESVGSDAPPVAGRRLYDCGSCNAAWDEVCFVGVESVCDLVSYGNPFSMMAETSLDVLCSTLGGLCQGLPAGEPCSGQCEECLPPLTITLEFSTDSDAEESGQFHDLDLSVIEPSRNLVYFGAGEGVVGSLVASQNKEVYTVFAQPSSRRNHAIGRYTVFADWWSGDAPVFWKITAVTGSGAVLFAGEGEFTGGCDTMKSSHGFSIATTEIFSAELSEYVDNGCYVEV